MTICFFFRNRPPEELPHQKRSPRRGEFDSSTPEVPGGLLVTVFEAFRRTAKPAAWTGETLPDKKIEPGSLHSPWECDDRLPPDAGYYLDLVLPRKEEPGKKTGSRCKIIAWKNIRNRVIKSHAIYSRISVNLPVKPSRTLVNLLAREPRWLNSRSTWFLVRWGPRCQL